MRAVRRATARVDMDRSRACLPLFKVDVQMFPVLSALEQAISQDISKP